MASFDDPPMGVATDVGFTRDANGNPIINPDNVIAAKTPIGFPPEPSQESIDMGLTTNVNDMSPEYSPTREEAQAQLAQGEQLRRQHVPPETMNGQGGPDTPVEYQGSLSDPYGAFLGGMASAPHTPYAGGLQSLGDMFGGGAKMYQAQLADMRSGLNGRKGNTPLFVDVPDGQGGYRRAIYRMTPEGSEELNLPDGAIPLKPNQFQDFGGSVGVYGYGQSHPTNVVPKTLAPGETPTVRGQQALETGRGKTQAEIENAYPVAFGTIKSGDSETSKMLKWTDDAIRLSKEGNGGGWASLLQLLPESDAMDLSNKVGVLRDSIAANNLVAIKAEGGAFGALSDRELRLLGRKFGDLSTQQKPVELQKTLGEIKELLATGNRRRIDTFNLTYENVPNFQKYGSQYNDSGNLINIQGPWVQNGTPGVVDDTTFDGFTNKQKQDYISEMTRLGIEL